MKTWFWVTATVVTVAVFAAVAGASSRPVGRSVSSGRLTSKGLIAFTRYRLQSSPLWSEIWVARPDGSRAVRVSRSGRAVEDDQAHFSPDGRWIVFDRCTQDGPCSIWRVRPTGAGQTRVMIPCAARMCDDSNAAFAPDGRHLLIQHEWGTVKSGTIPDNDQIEYSAIIETNLDGSHAVTLREFDGWSGGFEAPRLTPNGRTVVFRAYRWRPDRILPRALYTAPKTGGPAHRITPLTLQAGGEAVSPDGRSVLFKSTFGGELTPGNALYTVSIDGSGLRQLIPPSASYVITGSYSPDGRSIVFATNDGATGSFADVFTRDLSTGIRGQVTDTQNLDGWPDWGR
ncbi:MAG TPA: hypothetical protein VGU02_02790 [Gaiellaceae bacterium]|nr:hypothetical protein [Gaiellaceae bacterium]